MNVLLTAFAPASEETESPSWSWIERAATPETADPYVATLQLPPTWDGCFAILEAALRQPWDAVVCVAAGPTRSLAVERVATNEANVARKDSLGRRPRARVIDPDGEIGYWTGLPYRDLLARLAEAGLPAAASHSAGGGLPNFVFYKLMRWIQQCGRPIVGGLVRVPQRQGISLVPADAGPRFVECLLASLDPRARREAGLAFDPALVALRVSREP